MGEADLQLIQMRIASIPGLPQRDPRQMKLETIDAFSDRCIEREPIGPDGSSVEVGRYERDGGAGLAGLDTV
jgi:hypothetical protein